MRELDRREVQKVEVALLEEFADICEAHGLKYYLAYGTLIGAARHEGFIPWDDDVDVMMPREDFEKLLSHFDQWRLRTTSKFIHSRNGQSRFPYGRIIDTRTLVDETYCEGGEELGAWIDIFPLEDMPINGASLFRKILYWNTARMFAVSEKGRVVFRTHGETRCRSLLPPQRIDSLRHENGRGSEKLGRARLIMLCRDTGCYRARKASTQSLVRASNATLRGSRIPCPC